MKGPQMEGALQKRRFPIASGRPTLAKTAIIIAHKDMGPTLGQSLLDS